MYGSPCSLAYLTFIASLFSLVRAEPFRFALPNRFVVRGGNQSDGYTIVQDTVLHDSWRKLINRRVRMPSGLEVDFEIVAQKGSDAAVLVFVWNTETHTATLVREYMPALHRKVVGLAAGMVEEHKHGNGVDDDRLTAAKHELEEETRMAGGSWHLLTRGEAAMDKYSTTRLSAYLVIDPTPVPESEAKPRDETEEGMEVVHGISVEELHRMIADGEMTIVGGWGAMLALNKLRELGEIQ